MRQIPSIELADSEAIRQYQEELLIRELPYVLRNSRFYADLFRQQGLSAADIRSLDDLHKIPVTTKQDLQQRNNDFLCVEPSRIVDYVTTSGTSGEPVLFALTNNDLERLAENEWLSYQCVGLSPDSIIQLTTTMDRRFMAGLAYFLGARKAGIGMIRVGSGVPGLQWDSIMRIRPDVIICVPSFLLKMIEYAEANGLDYRSSSVRKVIGIGEPLRNPDLTENALAKRIREKWDVALYATYASTEMGAAFTECDHGRGGHHHPGLLITEFLDDQNRPVRRGEAGELVITTLGVEGMPLLRFKTGDVMQAMYEPCACGRTTLRVGPVIGRKNQMIKYKGTTLYPPAMFDLLNDLAELENYVIEISTSEIGEDEILVKIGAKEPSEELMEKVRDRFRAKLRVSPKLQFAPVREIEQLKFPENSRKSVTLIDHR